MRSTLLFILFICASAQAQVDLNLELISRVEAPESANDVWGFEHSNGIEYAILGTRANTKVYSLETPAAPEEKFVIEGPVTTWRDIKNHNDFVYVTTDGISEGLTIIDMTDPENIQSQIWSPPLEIGDTADSLRTCHNLYIDESGYAYLSGCNNSNGGVIILDIFTDPLNPEMVGYADLSYSHDVYVKGDRMYTSEIFEGWFGVYDISDRSNPLRLATQVTGTTFTHNSWTSDDQQFIFTTDERANAYLESYDISDLGDIEKLDSYRPAASEGNGVIPHNTHYKDGFLITSWYTDGIVVVDGNKPDNLVKVAGYDTWLDDHGGFNGCWGAFPYLPSGLILASDRTTGMFVFNPTYQRACYLEGKITSEGTGLPINGASITILNADQIAKTNSNAAGNYKTGIATAGEYEILVSHPDFEEMIVSAELINGEVTILDVALVKPDAVIFTGTVVRDIDGQVVPDAMVKLVYNDGRIDELVADANGNVVLEIPEGSYDIYAASWGYKIGQYQLDTATDPIIEIRLEQGYRDEFFFDFNWGIAGDANEGSFMIGTPQELILNNNLINIGADSQEDLGDLALLTGDGTNHPIHLDYVKNGTTIATTPSMDLSIYDYPIINFDLFYRHDGYTIPGSYSLDVAIIKDGESRTIRRFEMSDTTWTSIEIHPKQAFQDLSDVSMSLTMFNDQDGIFTEVAVDVFEVVAGTPSSIDDFVDSDINIYPK